MNVIEDDDSTSSSGGDSASIHAVPQADEEVIPWTNEQISVWQSIQTEIGNIGSSQAMQTALMVCPQLVWTESNPFRYMACHDNNVRQVAQCLINYWGVRVEIFGMARAFLPLSLDIQVSALDRYEIAILETGCVQWNLQARRGKVIFYTEVLRRKEAGLEANTPEARLRLSFYAFQIVSGPVAAQNGGVLALHVGRDKYFQAADAVVLKATTMLSVFPIKKWENHFFDCRPQSSPQGWGILQCLLTFILQHPTYFHNPVEDLRDWVEEMEFMGCDRRELPIAIGGTWDSQEKMREWLTTRAAFDQSRFNGSLEAQEENVDVEIPLNEEANRFAEMDQVQSRAVLQLQDAVRDQTHIQQQLLRENERLVSSFEAAEVVAQHFGGAKKNRIC